MAAWCDATYLQARRYATRLYGAGDTAVSLAEKVLHALETPYLDPRSVRNSDSAAERPAYVAAGSGTHRPQPIQTPRWVGSRRRRAGERLRPCR